MEKFVVTIEMENEALSDMPATEVARILRKLADTIYNNGEVEGPFVLRDYNGNTVGKAGLVEE